MWSSYDDDSINVYGAVMPSILQSYRMKPEPFGERCFRVATIVSCDGTVLRMETLHYDFTHEPASFGRAVWAVEAVIRAQEYIDPAYVPAV